jgi:hypothetical protein
MKSYKEGKGEEAEYNEEMSDEDDEKPEVEFTPPRSRCSSWSESGGPSGSRRSSLELKRQSPSLDHADCRSPAKKPRPGLDRTSPSHVSENDSKFHSCGVAVFKL